MHATRSIPVRLLLPLVVAALVAVGCSSDDGGSSTAAPAGTAGTGGAGTTLATLDVAGERGVLLDAESVTILDQPLAYPTGDPEISSAIVVLEPGEETGWHHHDAPLYGYVLSGEVTVDYGEDGVRTYPAGTAFLEAIGTSHDGRNDGTEPVRILTVNLGAAGVENTVED